MPITTEAIYENGVLRPTQLLPLAEHERVRITVVPLPSLAEECYGMMGWTGDDTTLERIALDPEFDPQESA
jgi:predicted DNA-binding antitoxin AbrB/MazE fold protein